MLDYCVVEIVNLLFVVFGRWGYYFGVFLIRRIVNCL